MHGVYDLKEKAIKELELYGNKERLDASDWEVIDLLAHTTKNLCKIIESYEEEDEASYRGGSYGYMRYPDHSMRRGRDSMGRYTSNRGYSRSRDDLMDNLHRLMNDASTETERQEYQRMIDRMQNM